MAIKRCRKAIVNVMWMWCECNGMVWLAETLYGCDIGTVGTDLYIEYRPVSSPLLRAVLLSVEWRWTQPNTQAIRHTHNYNKEIGLTSKALATNWCCICCKL